MVGELARLTKRSPSAWAERPATIGGQIRGIPGTGAYPDVAELAVEITAPGFFSRSLSSSTAERRPAWTAAALTCAAWLIAYVCFWAWPPFFGAWDAKAGDYLFLLRARLQCPVMPCRDRVVHVDLTYSGLRRMGNRQLTRAQFARVVDNLASFGVAAQVFDVVFALQSTPEDDAALVGAAKAAGNAYFGLVVLTGPPKLEFDDPSQEDAYVRSAAWDVQVDGPAEAIAEGFAPVPTFEALTTAARGIGFLNLAADSDGVFRRVPLVFRYRGRVFPSLALRVAADYLGVSGHNVVVRPGRSITLRGARLPDAATATDVVIPIGRDGRYRVNFAGPWEAFRHESLQGVYRANNDPVASVLLAESLKGRIALVADISTARRTSARSPPTNVIRSLAFTRPSSTTSWPRRFCARRRCRWCWPSSSRWPSPWRR